MADETTSPESLADAARRNGRPATLPGRLIDSGARGASWVAGTAGLDRAVERAVVEALDSETVDRIWARMLASDETQRLIERIAEAPELRAAIASQSVGVFEDLAQQARGVARRLDGAIERPARFIGRRGRRAEAPVQAGFVSRLMGMVVDAAILNLFFLVASALIALGAALLVPEDSIGIAIGATMWGFAAGLYLLVFWAGSGQTPGMRLMGIRLHARGMPEVGAARALCRLLGLGICLITLGIGFLPILFTRRRVGFADLMADTEVVYVPSVVSAAPWSELPVQ